LGLLKQVKGQLLPDEKPESVKQWLDYLGTDMYVCALGGRKFAISKSLLTQLGYDVEEFTVEVVKYRRVTLE
jgi:hypothetical protein